MRQYCRKRPPRLCPVSAKYVAPGSADVRSRAGGGPVDLAGGYPRPQYNADGPTWAADSRFLAFHLSYCPDPDCRKGWDRIVVADTAARRPTLAVLGDGLAPAWQPAAP